MRTKINVTIIVLLLIFQSFFSAALAYAETSTTAVPESAVSNFTNTVMEDVYSIPNPEPLGAPPSIAPMIQAADSSVQVDNILTKLILTDETGRIIDAVDNPGVRVDIGAAVQLSYEWEIPDNQYKAGDTFTFKLQRSIKMSLIRYCPEQNSRSMIKRRKEPHSFKLPMQKGKLCFLHCSMMITSWKSLQLPKVIK